MSGTVLFAVDTPDHGADNGFASPGCARLSQVCVSAVDPELFPACVAAGADMVELGNFDSFYERGVRFSADDVLEMTRKARALLPTVPLSVTVPHTLDLNDQASASMGCRGCSPAEL